MTREEAIRVLEEFQVIDDWTMVHLPPMEDAVNMAIEALKAPTGLISKQDVKWQLQEWINELNEAIDMLDSIPSAEPKIKCIAQIKVDRDDIEDMVNEMAKEIAEPKMGRDCTDFVRWLMDEVLDEENWQWNAVANGEIICRKLKKLGLIDVVDGYYVETQETGWIPVSEMLPKEDGVYLATCDGEICGEDEPISSMAEFENGKWVDDEDDYQCVLAWMPLPEPWKGGEKE